MKKIAQKHFKILVISLIILSVSLFSIYQSASAINVIRDGLTIGNDYTIEGFESNPYSYDEDWRIYINNTFVDSNAGSMSLFRPTDPEQSNKSRAFAHADTLYAWGAAMGGNPQFVKDSMLGNMQMQIKDNSSGKVFDRYYIRDIAAKAGVSEVLVYDTIWDNSTGYIVVKTTPFPTADIRAPQEVVAGKPFSIRISGEEFEPSSRDQITYTITAENQYKPLTSGVQFTNKLTWFEVPITLNEPGKRVLNLTIKDKVERSKSVSVIVNVKEPGEPIPDPDPDPDPEQEPDEENIPPVAMVHTESMIYWVEEAQFQDHSYDADGEIVSRNFDVDGKASGATKKFSRVTQPEQHTVSLRVVDDKGASATASKDFQVLPTTPTAEFSINGSTKVNRRISLDGTLSDKVSPVHVAPIDYSLSNWTIKPLTEGVTQEDILIRTSSDKSKRDFLVRKPGEYEVTLTVTNKFNETSEPVTKKITVEPDLPPVAKFTVDSAKAIRAKNDGKQATIKITDSSVSNDQDVIKKRIYYMEFDSNNDGYFGTALDEPRKIISNTNETVVNYKTSKVGNYRISMEVVEGFGQDTLLEFIKDEHYLRDSSGVIDSTGKVSTYQEPQNFNTGLYDTSVEVINVPPVIDFGVRRQNSIDVVLNFGGMDIATQQHQTGQRPGAGINNGGGGGTYDHYYYTYDETEKNRLSAYASTLQANLLAKGIDAKVTIDNSYYKVPDSDGVGVRNIPVWGWVDHGSYTYSSYTGTSPYSGSWEVTSSSSTPNYAFSSYSGTTPYSGDWEVLSSSSTPITQQVPAWCYESNTAWSDKEKKFVEVVHSHPPPCSNPSNVSSWDTVVVGTQYTASLRKLVSTTYTASLRKWVPDWRFEVTNYTNEGVNSTEQVNTTDFTAAYNAQAYRSNAQKLYMRMDKRPWDWMGNTTKVNAMINKTKTDNIYFWNMATSANKLNAERIYGGAFGFGQFSLYDPTFLYNNVKTVENHIINKYFMEEDGVNTTIVLGDKLDYTTKYTDHENDPEIKREWKFTHDPTKVNGRIIDSAPTAPIAQSGLYIDSPLQLTQVGTYRVQLRAQDDPVDNGDERFINYRKWSDEEVQREYIINVHRRPIADFKFTVEPGTFKLSLDPSISYDPDHQFNRSDKGIVEHTWTSYVLDGVTYNGQPPATLSPNKVYDVSLQVKDIDGAYGVVTKRISTENMNIKPIALFDAPEIVVDTQELNIVDRSYDPNGDPLTDYQITIRKQGEAAILKTLTSFPNSFAEMGLGAGNYVIGLTVKDIPRIPPQLTSDLYERNIKVVVNRPPVSKFTLSPTPLLVNGINTYQDQSSDPDGHPLKNYSWTIEKLAEDNSVIQSWNTGVKPTDWRDYGTGRFRVTQTVFDDPPYPLSSLSGSYSIIVNVILGPQKPYALFDYSPFPVVLQGNTINLNPDRSFDPDGTVTAWEWSIKAPNGTVTTSAAHYPTIPNAQIGTYEITLFVRDNSGLRSTVPSIQTITVSPQPPNKPPVAVFIWEPFKPTLGQKVKFDGNGSYDLDGTIVSWKWTFVGSDGSTQTSTQRYPEITAATERYNVSLEVTDDKGAKGTLTQVVNVNIAWITGKVVHTPEWADFWIKEGFEPETNQFLSGEKFIIRLTSSPANKVWGKVHFGNEVGLVDIPSSAFRLISTSQFEYKWEVELWRSDFEKIPKGGYMFEFFGIHPVNNPTLQSNSSYLIEIVGNVYEKMNFHRNY